MQITSFNSAQNNRQQASFGAIKYVKGSAEQLDAFFEKMEGIVAHGHLNGEGVVLDGKDVTDFFKGKYNLEAPDGLVNAKSRQEAQNFVVKNPRVVQSFATKLGEIVNDTGTYLRNLFAYKDERRAAGAAIESIDLMRN